MCPQQNRAFNDFGGENGRGVVGSEESLPDPDFEKIKTRFQSGHTHRMLVNCLTENGWGDLEAKEYVLSYKRGVRQQQESSVPWPRVSPKPKWTFVVNNIDTPLLSGKSHKSIVKRLVKRGWDETEAAEKVKSRDDYLKSTRKEREEFDELLVELFTPLHKKLDHSEINVFRQINRGLSHKSIVHELVKNGWTGQKAAWMVLLAASKTRKERDELILGWENNDDHSDADESHLGCLSLLVVWLAAVGWLFFLL